MSAKYMKLGGASEDSVVFYSRDPTIVAKVVKVIPLTRNSSGAIDASSQSPEIRCDEPLSYFGLMTSRREAVYFACLKNDRLEIYSANSKTIERIDSLPFKGPSELFVVPLDGGYLLHYLDPKPTWLPFGETTDLARELNELRAVVISSSWRGELLASVKREKLYMLSSNGELIEVDAGADAYKASLYAGPQTSNLLVSNGPGFTDLYAHRSYILTRDGYLHSIPCPRGVLSLAPTPMCLYYTATRPFLKLIIHDLELSTYVVIWRNPVDVLGHERGLILLDDTIGKISIISPFWG